MSSVWPRRITTVLLCLSCLLQIAAIFSPGWLVDVRKNVEEYDSIFYKQSCLTLDETDCETESFREIHAQARLVKQRAGMAHVAIAQLDYTYHVLVLKQVLVTVSLAATLMLIIAQMVRTCNADRRYHRLITRAAVFGTIPVGLMISVICRQLVDIAYMIDLLDNDDDSDHTYIGFPYSLAMYIASLLFLLLAILVLTNQSAGPAKATPIVKKRPIYDEDEYVSKPPPAVKSDYVPIHETAVTTPSENTEKPKPKAVEPPRIAVEKPKPVTETKSAEFYSEKL